MKVIEVENLSKEYKLGAISTRSLKEDLQNTWQRYMGKGNQKLPFMVHTVESEKRNSFWALKDINFEVQKGEVLGIIGKNGAGKSTLLKILSKVTSPTSGKVKIKGRIASLLEVGTGFHPDLSGMENIYMNGAILGMTKKEIHSKFDEIVDFAGVEKFIDTPVKRYSSGMYVRLAFAVAAHLEPEILIVDEVLAVGDAEFQKKCLGKMKDVAGHGRTVLFVSHNMQAVKSLCNNAIWLENGIVKQKALVNDVLNNYLSDQISNDRIKIWSYSEAPGNELIRLVSVKIKSEDKNLSIKSDIEIEYTLQLESDCDNLNLSQNLFSLGGELIFNSVSPSFDARKGKVKISCILPSNLLNNGTFYLSTMAVKDRSICLHYFEEVLSFQIDDDRTGEKWFGEIKGLIRPSLNWEISNGNY